MTMALIGFVLLFFLAFGGVPLGLAMLLAGVGGFAFVRGSDGALAMLAQIMVDSSANYGMSVLPMFVLMGIFVHRAEISEELYDAANAWLGHFKGGLAHATVVSCALFAAISGSSIATAATMSRVAIPPMRRLGYHDRLSTGSVASAGVLGVLIPPSVPLVLFGLLTETDIRKLFIATIIPGLLLTLFFIIAVWVTVSLNPALGPRGPKFTLKQKFIALKGVWSVIALFVFVMGGLYSGVFTVNEAASVAAVLALVFALLRGRLDWPSVWLGLRETASATAMIYTIIIGASVFAYFVTLARVPEALVAVIDALPISPLGIVACLIVAYLALGAIFDEIAAMLITLPFVLPVIERLGFDPVWWGIVNVVVVELGMIIPPIGIIVFVLHGLAPQVPIRTIYKGVMPFIAADLLLLALLVVFPGLVLWLPTLIRG